MEPLLEVNNIEVIYHNVIPGTKGDVAQGRGRPDCYHFGDNGAGKTHDP